MPITCRPLGGLGNNLHVIASTLGIAHRLGESPALPPTWRYREFFSIPDEFFRDDPGAQDAHALSGLPPAKAAYLHSFALWRDISEDVIRWFRPSAFVVQRLQQHRQATAVHVRRGDYVSYGPENYVPLWETSYYDNCEMDKALVYTDDPIWVKGRWPCAEVAPQGEDWHDLFQMAGHSQLVIANSSFSYWAAMLSADPWPRYPLRWFGPLIEAQGWTTKDFIPEHWIGIS